MTIFPPSSPAESTSKESASLESSYNTTPYSINAFPQTTPNRLAVIAALFGLASPKPEKCRVLELGCAAGGNLIPMALIHPQSAFTGIDLSERQIADGRKVIQQLQLPNLHLHHKSILDITPEFGQFDYILAHGVYSWVPPEVQSKIVDICKRNLSPSGVAYVSYNTYPGWHARAAIREMLWYHTEHLESPDARIAAARQLLAFLTQSIPATETAYSILLRQELALLQRTPDTYLLHEHLEQFNEPLYFHQFIARAAERNLQYLGEANLGAMIPANFGAEAESTLRALSPDLLHMEQYMDFLRNRMFRQTLLCHDNLSLDHSLRPELLRQFHIASPAKPDGSSLSLHDETAQTFCMAGGGGHPKLTTRDPLMKAALFHLSQIYPASMPYKKLVIEAQSILEKQTESGAAAGGRNSGSGHMETSLKELPTRLLNAHLSNLVELTLTPPAFTVTLSSHPIASPYARLRAAANEKITNLRLETVQLTEPSRLLLTHLDGLHDRAALARVIENYLQSHPPTEALPNPELSRRERAARYISEALPLFAKSALLVS
ncbi:MAG: methyltransferase regulatory domain-containing protein [Phycisphaerae bacterium]